MLVDFSLLLNCYHKKTYKCRALWFFDKICSQMLNNFIAFSTVLYNFHVALFYLINDLLHHFTVKIFLLSDCSFKIT